MAVGGVEFAHVSFTLPGKGRRLITDVSFTVAAGSTTALLGRSGSGKTTLLRMVNAMVKPTSGRVTVGGRDAVASAPIALRRSIGYVIQETGLFPHMSIVRNVRLPLDLSKKFTGHDDEADRVVETAMLQCGLPLQEFGSRFPWQLSGGQRQRAGLARALAADPAILLMDEPFGALDPLTRAEMQTMLRDLLRRVGKTTLIVTHDLDEALYLADRVILLEAGSIVADLPSAEIASSTNQAVRMYVAATHRARLDPGGAP